MKIAVTGVSGYLAQVLFPLLEKDNDIDKIIGLDMAEPRQKSSKLSFVKRDVRDANIKDDFAGCDALIHLAFIVMPLRSESEMDSINIDGTKNVFEAAAKAGVKNVVYTSSVASYGGWADNPRYIKEDWPRRPMPNFYYSRAKATIENWLDGFEKNHPEMRIVRLRPCIFLGPKINNMMRDVYNSKVMMKPMGMDPEMQFVWDEDVAAAIVLGLKKNVRGAFNIAGDGFLTSEDMGRVLGKKVIRFPYKFAYALLKLLWKLGLNKKLHVGWLEVLQFPIVVDTSKAKSELDWKPTMSSEESLKKFIESLQ